MGILMRPGIYDEGVIRLGVGCREIILSGAGVCKYIRGVLVEFLRDFLYNFWNFGE